MTRGQPWRAAALAAGVLCALTGDARADGPLATRDALGAAAHAAAGQPAQPGARPARPAQPARPTQPAPVQIRPRGGGQPGQIRPGDIVIEGAQGSQVQIERGDQPGLFKVQVGPPGGAPNTLGAPGDDGGPVTALNRSTSAAVFFWLFALMIVSGSIFVVTRSNLITAVMGMVGTFFGIAAVYAMLYATFLTAIQVLVYAGAIMVLFVFVIMILNKPEVEPWRVHTGARDVLGKLVVPGVALLYLFGRLASVLWSIPVEASQLAVPPALPLSTINTATGAPELTRLDFGSTKALGYTLFGEYLFPFEAVSLVLLIAVVGAVAVARPHQRPPRVDGQDGHDGPPDNGKEA